MRFMAGVFMHRHARKSKLCQVAQQGVGVGATSVLRIWPAVRICLAFDDFLWPGRRRKPEIVEVGISART